MEGHKTRPRNNLDTGIIKESMQNILTTLKKRLKIHMNKEQQKHSENTISCIIQITLQSTVLRESKATLPIHTEMHQPPGSSREGESEEEHCLQASVETFSSWVRKAGHAVVSDSTHAHTGFPN